MARWLPDAQARLLGAASRLIRLAGAAIWVLVPGTAARLAGVVAISMTVVTLASAEKAQLRRHVPPRRDIEDYGATLRQVDALFEVYLNRLQRRGVTDRKTRLGLGGMIRPARLAGAASPTGTTLAGFSGDVPAVGHGAADDAGGQGLPLAPGPVVGLGAAGIHPAPSLLGQTVNGPADLVVEPAEGEPLGLDAVLNHNGMITGVPSALDGTIPGSPDPATLTTSVVDSGSLPIEPSPGGLFEPTGVIGAKIGVTGMVTAAHTSPTGASDPADPKGAAVPLTGGGTGDPERERCRLVWLTEDPAVWQPDTDAAPPVIAG